MVKINWTSQANLDLKDIFDFIAKNSDKYAHVQIAKIKTNVKIFKNTNENW